MSFLMHPVVGKASNAPEDAEKSEEDVKVMTEDV